MGTLYGSLWSSVVPLPQACPPYPSGTKIQMEDVELSGDSRFLTRGTTWDYVITDTANDRKREKRQEEEEGLECPMFTSPSKDQQLDN